jgi:signal transduction histidine kinase
MAGRTWSTIAALAVLAISGTFLALWLSGVPDLVRFAAWRGKTNACIGLVVAGCALLALARGGRWLEAVGTALAVLAGVIGGATFMQYVLAVDLGIDQLVARDWPFAESSQHPNRMAPNAALSFVLIGVTLALVGRRRRTLVHIAHVCAVLLIVIDGIALLGYLLDATFLYRAGPFVRISPYTALCFVLLAGGAIVLRADHGIIPWLRDPGLGPFTVRRLLLPVVLVPAFVGWLGMTGQDAGWWGAPSARAIEVLAFVALFASVMASFARTLDHADERRKASELELRRVAELTAALSRALTVEEVARATVDLGVPALGADAGGIFLLEPDRANLRLLASHGYRRTQAAPYDRVPLAANLPVCDAVRAGTSVFITSAAEFAARYPQVAERDPETEAWAAILLEGRGRLLGAIGLSFKHQLPEAEARARIDDLTAQCGQALDRAILFEEVQAARDSARDASRAKDQFLAMLGHELRNPLSPISHALELMKARDPVPSRERMVIERQVRHMTRLVDDLLDVSRIAQGKIELRREIVEVAAITRDAVELVTPLLTERGHRLAVRAAPDLHVDGDRARLIQVVSNLLNNAARYTPPGGELQLVAARDGDSVVIEVIDNGTGIAPELLAHVFEPFVQGERTIERAAGGLGLGLAIVNSLVHLHDGTIEVASAGESRGSRFTVRLPARDPGAHAPPEPARAARATNVRRVLVVDDNVDAAELMAASLENAGHSVRVAFDGESALAVAGEHAPDCVMLDIGLPRLDGYEVARRLRTSDVATGRHRTIVAMTGYGQAEDVQRAMDAGFDRHLVKPVSIDVVLEVVNGS